MTLKIAAAAAAILVLSAGAVLAADACACCKDMAPRRDGLLRRNGGSRPGLRRRSGTGTGSSPQDPAGRRPRRSYARLSRAEQDPGPRQDPEADQDGRDGVHQRQSVTVMTMAATMTPSDPGMAAQTSR